MACLLAEGRAGLMPRTKHIVWIYECDASTPDGRRACIESFEVARGDEVSTGRGTVIHDQADADAAARQHGWKLGKVVLGPLCMREATDA